MTYYGLTHGLPTWQWFLWLWRKLNCRRRIHLFDEVLSSDDHYLSCDACGLEAHISKINTEYVK